MKTCARCKRKKPVTAFYKMPFRKDGKTRQGDGYRNTCKACSYEMEQQRRDQWPANKIARRKRRQKEAARRWDRKHPYASKAAKANLHAKRVGATGRLSASDVEVAWQQWAALCWVCGFPATELDHYRPINGKGGGTNTADNIRPICRECNQKRSHKWHGDDIAEKEASMLRSIKLLLNEATYPARGCSPLDSPPQK